MKCSSIKSTQNSLANYIITILNPSSFPSLQILTGPSSLQLTEQIILQDSPAI